MSEKPEKVDSINRWWRPSGAWGVVFNVTVLPFLFVAMAWFGKGVEHLPTLVGLYVIIAGLFAGLFKIRQDGKDARITANKEIVIERIRDDDTP